MHPGATCNKVTCYHCGEECSKTIAGNGRYFCCEGCRMVYELLNRNGLCAYYNLNDKPGLNQRIETRKDKFAFLDDEKIQQQLVSFSDNENTHVTFYLPQVHCSSCLYLLEHLSSIDAGIVSSRVNFERKEVAIIFHRKTCTLRSVAELLARVGYEPYISLRDLRGHQPRANKSMIYQLGVAGFCFANIMLLSFPEYFGLEARENSLRQAFRGLNLVLALPVFFYSARPFFTSGWKAIRHGFLNIDAPIALAILVTFARSLHEIVTGTGAGYFDSMSGIVFFMLTGRVLQDKTFKSLSFDRDFTAYFPIAITVLKEGMEVPTALPDVTLGNTLLIHHGELIPADGILTRGKAFIDYSFVTGESEPVPKETGELVYAGGKQTRASIEILVIKEVAQSYLTSLWTRSAATDDTIINNKISFVHRVSRYFTYVVFLVAMLAGLYWWFSDTLQIGNVVTAVLIVACPCALLLSNTFTNGNILRICSRNKLYLRGAQTIEDIASINHIVFDKTGTLTQTGDMEVSYTGAVLSQTQMEAAASVAAQSAHPLSRAVSRYLHHIPGKAVSDFRELSGQGITGFVGDNKITLGSSEFVTGRKPGRETAVWIKINGEVYGSFHLHPRNRAVVPRLLQSLSRKYRLSLLSGDQPRERNQWQLIMGEAATLRFQQSPADKLNFIVDLQQKGERVMMIGDGLNDAGALRQSNVGVAVADDINNFTPASDAILDAGQLVKLPKFIQLCKLNKRIVLASFIMSACYNIAGLWFAVRGELSPLTAAILMPASSLSILLLTFGCTSIAARIYRL